MSRFANSHESDQPGSGSRSRRERARSTRLLARGAILACVALYVASVAACSDDDADDSNADPGSCPEGGGAVAGPADAHCIDDDGAPIVQMVGACSTEVEESSSDAAEEEEYLTSYGSESDDD